MSLQDRTTVRVLDYCDGFGIDIINTDLAGNEEIARYRFDQEDTRESLLDVFSKLGFTTEYEEIY